MTPKEYLLQLKNKDLELNSLQAELDYLKSTPISATHFNDVRVSHSSNPHYSEDLYMKRLALTERLEKEINQKLALYEQISQQIEGIGDDRYRALLRYYYIKDYTFEVIADKMFYSLRMIHRLHNQALEAFEDKYLKGH